MHRRGEAVPLEECRELIAQIDSDGDNVIDFSVSCSVLQYVAVCCSVLQ